MKLLNNKKNIKQLKNERKDSWILINEICMRVLRTPICAEELEGVCEIDSGRRYCWETESGLPGEYSCSDIVKYFSDESKKREFVADLNITRYGCGHICTGQGQHRLCVIKKLFGIDYADVYKIGNITGKCPYCYNK